MLLVFTLSRSQGGGRSRGGWGGRVRFRALLPRPTLGLRDGAAGDPSTGRPRSDVADVRPARPSARRLEQLGRGAPGRDGGSLLHPSDNLQHGRLARMGNLPRSHATARCPGRLGRAASGSGCCMLVACPLVRAHTSPVSLPWTTQAHPRRCASTLRARSSCATWRTRRCSGTARTGS